VADLQGRDERSKELLLLEPSVDSSDRARAFMEEMLERGYLLEFK